VILNEECRPRLLRKGMFASKKDEITGAWRELRNEELHNLYSFPNRIFKLGMKRWTEHLAQMREKRNAYKVSVGKPEE
jgi:hypothetical protein